MDFGDGEALEVLWEATVGAAAERFGWLGGLLALFVPLALAAGGIWLWLR